MSEKDLQKQTADFLRKFFYHKLVFTHIPNEAPTNNYGWWMSQKSKGLESGSPDWIITCNGRCIFIELKYGKGKQSAHQLEFERRCIDTGTTYHLVYDLDTFRKIVDDFYNSNIDMLANK